MSLHDVNAMYKSMSDIAIAILSLFNQLNQLIKLTTIRMEETEDLDEKAALAKDIKMLNGLKEKMEKNPNYQLDIHEQALVDKYIHVELPDKFYNTALEYLKEAKASGDIKNSYVIQMNNDATFSVFGMKKDEEELNKAILNVQNSHINKEILTKQQLKDQALALYNGKPTRVLAVEIDKADEEMLKDHINNFKYHLGETKDGTPAVYFMEKDAGMVEAQLIANRLTLSSMSKEAILLDRAIHEEELFKNLYTKNGKDVYLCSPDHDMAIRIGDDTFEILKNGYSVNLGYEDGIEEQINGEPHYIYNKRGHEEKIEEYMQIAKHPIILEANEFQRDFNQRQVVMRQKMEEQISQNTPLTFDIKKEMDILFDPDKTYDPYELDDKTKRWIQIASKPQDRSSDMYLSDEEWVRKKQLEHEKLNLDRQGPDGLSGRTALVVDFTQSLITARTENALNNDYKEELIETYKELDLDDKEEIIKIITGMTPGEIEAISEHIEAYVAEGGLEDHINFIEMTDERVGDYWNVEHENERVEKVMKEIEDDRKDMDKFYERSGDRNMNDDVYQDGDYPGYPGEDDDISLF